MAREIAEDADLASTCTGTVKAVYDGFAAMIEESGDSITREVRKGNRKLNRPEWWEVVVLD
jgi:hypothetical protein